MFKKIVSNLPFSPTLISELGFYAKRLSKEEVTRKTGLILTALALVVQSLIVFSPPESANAASSGDLVHRGFKGRSDMLAACNNNTQGFRDLLTEAKITCQILSNSTFGEIHSRTGGRDAGWLSWNRVQRLGMQKGERLFTIANQQIYVRPLAAFDIKNTKGNGSYYKAFYGKTTEGKDFAIMIACANILLKEYPEPKAPTPPPAPKDIRVCDLKSLSIITIKENAFDSSIHSKNLDDCKPKPAPTANCSSLVVKKISRTEAQIDASATTANGATIKSYTYIIKDGSGKEIKRTVNSASSSNSITHRFANEGKYNIKVIVSTSLGDRTATACEGEFAVTPIERCPIKPELPINHPDCQPCPAEPSLWVKDEDCSAKIVRKKEANNITAGKPADSVIAKASNRIEFKLTAKNEGLADAKFRMEDQIEDVLEYSSLFDRGGATLDEQTKVLSWGEIELKPGESVERSYVVQMSSQISPMSRGSSDPTSHDCRMMNVFGNTVEIEVDCPAPKIIEQTVPELPRTGPGENMIVSGVVAAVVTFLYLRSRQLNKEVRLIRREVTAGTI